MPLTTLKEIYEDAEARKYAVGGFDTSGGNLDIMWAILQTAEEQKSPVIISVGYEEMEMYNGIEFFAREVRELAAKSPVPVVLHLDHSVKVEHIAHAVEAGFTSVMFDGSNLSFEHNIESTRKVISIARAKGVTVEAELGRLPGFEGAIAVEEAGAYMTDPDKAKEFVEATGVDSLAIAIGNAHGFYKFEPKLDFDRLSTIKNLVSIPIVLHGSSGIPHESIAKAISLGVRKVNIATEMRSALKAGITARFEESPKEVHPCNILIPARETVKQTIRGLMRCFGSIGKADREEKIA